MKVTNLLIMAVLHFIAMVYTVSNIHLNLNQFYMAGIMTSPMLIFEIILMRSMYKNQRKLMGILGLSIVVLILFFFFIRKQTAITDKEFLRSMIPHHSGAILMCKNAPIQDLEIKKLCSQIIDSQQREIDIMEKKLDELD